MGQNTHFSQSHFPHFPEIEDPPHNSLCTNQLNALTDGKMEIIATPRHSPHGGGACGRVLRPVPWRRLTVRNAHLNTRSCR